MPAAEVAELDGREERENLLDKERGGQDDDDDGGDDNESGPVAFEARDTDEAAALVQVPQWRIQATLFLLAFKVQCCYSHSQQEYNTVLPTPLPLW